MRVKLDKMPGMGRISGHYEWDDDNLSPGKSKDGGLHQNLYKDGKLQGSARFIPNDQVQPEEATVTENVYIPSENRRIDDDLPWKVGQILGGLIFEFGERTAPHVKRWWADTAWPFLTDQNSKVQSKLRKRKQQRISVAEEESNTAGPTERGSGVTVPVSKMSASEAKARMLAAAAARAFSDEQMQMVNQSEIVGADGIEEVRAQLANMSKDELIGIVEQLVRNPAGLEEGNLASLASVLAVRTKELDLFSPKAQ